MVFDFTVKFKICPGSGFREALLVDRARNFCAESLFYTKPDDKGYYRVCFKSLRDCKAFLSYIFFSAYGCCLADAYIVSYNSHSCWQAVIGYCLIDHRKRYFLSYRKK